MTAIFYYNQVMTNIGNGTINIASDVFKVMLLNNYVYNDTHNILTDVSATEIPSGNGYTAGGATLNNVTYGYDATNNRTKWDADDTTWTASGGDIGPTTGAVIYSDTSANKNLITYIDFEGIENASDGFVLRISYNANGLLLIS